MIPDGPAPILGQPAERPFWLTGEWWSRTSKASIGLWMATLVSFLSTVIAANALGPRGYGPLTLALSSVVLLVTFLDFPLTEAVVHFGSRALAAGDRSGLRLLIRTSLLFDLVVGISVFSLVMLVSGPLASLVSRGRLDPSLVQLAALEALGRTIDGTTAAVLLLSRRPHVLAWAMGSTSAVRLLLVLVAVRNGGPRDVLLAFVVSSFAGAALQLFLGWRAGWRDWAKERSEPRTSVPIRRLARFGLNSSLTGSAIATRLAIVSVILGRTAGPVQVGILSVATFPLTLAAVVSAPIRMTMLPEQAKLAAEGRSAVLWRSVRVYTLVSLVLGISGAVIGWFALPWLLPALYGEGFSVAVPAARVMLVAAVATLAVAWSKTLPAAIGRPGTRTAISVGELAGTAVLVFILGRFGAVGAAMIVSIVSLCVAAVWWPVARGMLLNRSRRDS